MARDDFELARRMRDRIADALVGVKEDPQLCRLFEEEGVSSNMSKVRKAPVVLRLAIPGFLPVNYKRARRLRDRIADDIVGDKEEEETTAW